MEIEGLKVVHALPGRVRLKVAKVKGNPALARQTQEKLAQVPVIRPVEAKPGTGSPLIHYDMEDLFSIGSLEILSEPDSLKRYEWEESPWSVTSRTSGAARIRRPNYRVSS